MIWPFDPLTPLSYDLMAIDCPWPFDLYSAAGNHKSAAAHYDVMSIPEIYALPIGHLARGDCYVLSFVTAPRLAEGIRALEEWGAVYKSFIVWRKTTKNGKVRMGTGYRVRTMAELILVGTFGNPPDKGYPGIFDGIAREHSRKPDEFYQMVDRHFVGLRKVDVFSREARKGWDRWGWEKDKFNGPQPAAAEAQEGPPADGPLGW